MNAGLREEVRCPSCSRLLVLRTGPAIRPHFAHRPRQSCRQRTGAGPVRPLRLEQLTLFELEPEPVPTLYWEPYREPATIEPAMPGQPRRRRKAWLPRLVRWLKAKATGPTRN